MRRVLILVGLMARKHMNSVIVTQTTYHLKKDLVYIFREYDAVSDWKWTLLISITTGIVTHL